MPFSASRHAVMAPPNPLPITMASNVSLIGLISAPVPESAGNFGAVSRVTLVPALLACRRQLTVHSHSRQSAGVDVNDCRL